MAVTDFFAGEITTELLKMLITIARKATLCKPSAEQLAASITELLPIIEEIKYSGLELPAIRQRQLNNLSQVLHDGHELAAKILASNRWNVYKNIQLSRKMENIEKKVSMFMKGPIQAHILADLHHLRIEAMEKHDRLDISTQRLEQRLSLMKLGGRGDGGWLEEAVMKVDDEKTYEANLVNSVVGMAVGKRKVKEMIMHRDDLVVVGITGIGGCGKTTLSREIWRDDHVQSYYNNRTLFLTVSQSPNVEQLRQMISGLISESSKLNKFRDVPKSLIILDDVWSSSVLEQLIFRVPGCKTLVVSRHKFPPKVLDSTYELELLREDDALSLFCHSAYGTNSIPPGASKNLIKQIVKKCKGLPLALKVIGASLRDQPEQFWIAVKNRLSQAEPVSDSHETELLNRMKPSIDCLRGKVKDCFLDLGSFPEDKKISLDVLVNIWTELHDIDEEEAFTILVELSEKNLLTVVKAARVGEMYSCYYEISVTQHDVLRDLAIHLSNHESINDRKRLVMPRKEDGVPRVWERNADQPFNAQIVSIHTGEMRETDWFEMEFLKAEVLILNFSSAEFFLPPFVENMSRLRVLVLINYGSKTAQIHNFSVLTKLSSLRSLWFEKITIPELPNTTFPLINLIKISLVLCKITSKDQWKQDLSRFFPRLTDLTTDHCIGMTKLPSSICRMINLTILSVTNCEGLVELPSEIGKLTFLQILRTSACPNLKTLPSGICNLIRLNYIDISQCVSLSRLDDEIGGCKGLERIDMRECPLIKNLPKSAVRLRSLRRVVCDVEVYWQWQELANEISGLFVQVAEECFDLDWLNE